MTEIIAAGQEELYTRLSLVGERLGRSPVQVYFSVVVKHVIGTTGLHFEIYQA